MVGDEIIEVEDEMIVLRNEIIVAGLSFPGNFKFRLSETTGNASGQNCDTVFRLSF